MKIKLLDFATFDKLNRYDKRVAIARDVIARIDAGLIYPFHGDIFSNRMMVDEPQDFINENTCLVCAKGSLVCSWAGSFNHYTDSKIMKLDPDLTKGEYPSELVEIFGTRLLAAIETVFEGSSFTWNRKDYRGPLTENEIRFLIGCKNGLGSIMQNLIDNGGKLIIGDQIFE